MHSPICPRLLPFFALVVLAAACGPTQTQTTTAFWLEADGDPLLMFEPALPMAAGASVTTLEFDAVVKQTDRGRRPGADHNVEFALDSGEKLMLHYRIGAKRALPPLPGETVHVAVFRRGGSAERAAAVGLVLTGMRPGSFGQRRQILAAVSVDGVVPQVRLPPQLTAIQQTDVLAYQTAQQLEGQCYLSVAHNQLALGEEPGPRKANRQPLRLVPPGARVQLWNGETNLDVVLLDNRRVVTTTCKPEPPSHWSFAAVWSAQSSPAQRPATENMARQLK